jgi:hypothetical protein
MLVADASTIRSVAFGVLRVSTAAGAGLILVTPFFGGAPIITTFPAKNSLVRGVRGFVFAPC